VCSGFADISSKGLWIYFLVHCRKELASLDKFRERQKMIEELNTRKKKMLSEAIKQR